MKLAKSQFELELSNPAKRKFNLVIFGMSGSGKTHWSRALSHKYEYTHFEFDELIGKSPDLAGLIKDFPGRDTAEKLGNYFGMPWSKGFEAKEKVYLNLEKKFMSESQPIGSILDLTGSCIYHPTEMEAIKSTGLAIYLETSPQKQKEMLEIFLSNPKPVCWKGVFQKQDGEANGDALARCYPLLLAHRAGLYRRFADVTIPYAVHRSLEKADSFADEIKKQLPLHI